MCCAGSPVEGVLWSCTRPSVSGGHSRRKCGHQPQKTMELIVHGPGIERPPPPPPPIGDNDFWIAQYVSFQYLLVCKMNYSAFRDYLRWYIAAYWPLLKWACPLQIPNNRHLYHSLDTEILHMLVSMGSIALAAAVVLPRYGGLNYGCGINED